MFQCLRPAGLEEKQSTTNHLRSRKLILLPSKRQIRSEAVLFRSIDGQAPAPMPSSEPIEVQSFDDESAASSKMSVFTDVLTRIGSVAAVGFVEEKKETDSVASHLKK